MMRLVVLLLMVLSIAACGRIGNPLGRLGIGGGDARRGEIVADGIRYKARLSSESADRRAMTITVSPFASNPGAAMEAGRYQATKYCLKNYGGSDTVWTIGPDTPVGDLAISDDTVTLTGRCSQR